MAYYTTTTTNSNNNNNKSAKNIRLIFIIVLLIIVSITMFWHWSIFWANNQNHVEEKGDHDELATRIAEKPPKLQKQIEESDHEKEDDTITTTTTTTTKHRQKVQEEEGQEQEQEFHDDSSVTKLGPQIKSITELLNAGTEFFVFKEQESGQYLARPLNTNSERSKMKERIFRIQYDSKYSGGGGKKRNKKSSKIKKEDSPDSCFTIRGHTRLYLTSETNDRVTIDRLWARSFEQWHLEFDDTQDGTLRLRAHRNDKYVTVFKQDGKSLETVEDSKSKATKWILYSVPDCGGKQENEDDDNNNNSNQNQNPEVKCWGPDLSGYDSHRRKSKPGDGNKLPPPAPLRGPLLDSDDIIPSLKSAQFPLFGSPKPLPSATPANPNDPFDTVLIAERTIRNWASMGDGMVPIMFSDDPATVQIVEKVNKEIEEHKKQLVQDGCATSASKETEIPPHFRKQKTLIEQKFEIESHYKQPTYRGLFQKALAMFPDAPGVMYSNGDILFSPTLAQTIRKVASYYEHEKKRREDLMKSNNNNNKKKIKQLKGWMIVGQRVNYVVPSEFVLRDFMPNNNGKNKDRERYFTCADLEERHLLGGKKMNRTLQQLVMPQWVADVEEFSRQGQLFQGNAEDYFIVSRDMFDWKEIPEFVVGGVAFDNWITAKGVKLALSGEAIVVDAVKTITALHQNDAVNIKKSHMHPKSRFNLDLANRNGGWSGGYTADAPLASERLPDGTVTIYDKHALLFA